MPPRLRHPPTSAAVTTPKKGQNHTGQTQSSNDDEHANEGLRMADSDPVSSEHLFESYPHPNMYEPLWSKLSCSLQPASWMNESPVSSNLLGLESHLDTLYPVLINGLKSAANTCTLLLGFRGDGKSTLARAALRRLHAHLRTQTKSVPFVCVYLNAYLLDDDLAAIREVCRQVVEQLALPYMPSSSSSFLDCAAFLSSLLLVTASGHAPEEGVAPHEASAGPTAITAAIPTVPSSSSNLSTIISSSSSLSSFSSPSFHTSSASIPTATTVPFFFVLDEFDELARRGASAVHGIDVVKQPLLYYLCDLVQSSRASVSVIALSSVVDVLDLLEKRVRSRMPIRTLVVTHPIASVDMAKRIITSVLISAVPLCPKAYHSHLLPSSISLSTSTHQCSSTRAFSDFISSIESSLDDRNVQAYILTPFVFSGRAVRFVTALALVCLRIAMLYTRPNIHKRTHSQGDMQINEKGSLWSSEKREEGVGGKRTKGGITMIGKKRKGPGEAKQWRRRSRGHRGGEIIDAMMEKEESMKDEDTGEEEVEEEEEEEEQSDTLEDSDGDVSDASSAETDTKRRSEDDQKGDRDRDGEGEGKGDSQCNIVYPRIEPWDWWAATALLLGSLRWRKVRTTVKRSIINGESGNLGTQLSKRRKGDDGIIANKTTTMYANTDKSPSVGREPLATTSQAMLMLGDCSVLELAVLVSLLHLERKGIAPCNFELAHREYKQHIAKTLSAADRSLSQMSGGIAGAATAPFEFSKAAFFSGFQTLLAMGLVVPVASTAADKAQLGSLSATLTDPQAAKGNSGQELTKGVKDHSKDGDEGSGMGASLFVLESGEDVSGGQFYESVEHASQVIRVTEHGSHGGERGRFRPVRLAVDNQMCYSFVIREGVGVVPTWLSEWCRLHSSTLVH